jgi:hypothetical protein
VRGSSPQSAPPATVLAVSPGTVQPSTFAPRQKQPATEDAISQTDQPASAPRLISSSNSGVAGWRGQAGYSDGRA